MSEANHTPDAALLWARERLAEQWRGRDEEIASEYRAGKLDNSCEELRDLVAGFRAGQAHERRADAAKGTDHAE